MVEETEPIIYVVDDAEAVRDPPRVLLDSYGVVVAFLDKPVGDRWRSRGRTARSAEFDPEPARFRHRRRALGFRAAARHADGAAASGNGKSASCRIGPPDRPAHRRARGLRHRARTVLLAARERGCAIEVNGQPDRLDLDGWHCELAKEIGVKLVLSNDAHNPGELGFMRYEVEQARRGWLEPSDILNTRSLDGLRTALRRL